MMQQKLPLKQAIRSFQGQSLVELEEVHLMEDKLSNLQPQVPDSTNKEAIITTEERKNNQYDNIFKNPEAISLAPICNGINKLLKVPLSPAVKTKNTIIVPWIVIKAK